MYNGKHYPPMLSGSGYVMSRSTAACLYSQALQLPFFHLEVLQGGSQIPDQICKMSYKGNKNKKAGP